MKLYLMHVFINGFIKSSPFYIYIYIYIYMERGGCYPDLKLGISIDR